MEGIVHARQVHLPQTVSHLPSDSRWFREAHRLSGPLWHPPTLPRILLNWPVFKQEKTFLAAMPLGEWLGVYILEASETA